MRVHHIGYLVKKIEKAQEKFKNLGYQILKDIVFDEYRLCDICFMEKDGYIVELVSPKDKESIAYNLMKRYQNSPYHICYESDDIMADIENLLQQGYVQMGDLCVAPAIDGKKVVFLMSSILGMIELVEC